MKVLLFGASGMVGQGVLRECLLDPGVESVLSIVRTPGGRQDPKLRELVVKDLTDYSGIESDLTGFDACFFCLGVSSAGMSEAEYRRITYDITAAAGATLARLNRGMTFIYVSGEGTDSTANGRTMWARVKGETENFLLGLPFQSYMFRPGYIHPVHGEKSRTTVYRMAYLMMAPLYPLARLFMPNALTTTEHVGQAMLLVARQGAPQRVLATRDIEALVRAKAA